MLTLLKHINKDIRVGLKKPPFILLIDFFCFRNHTMSKISICTKFLALIGLEVDTLNNIEDVVAYFYL